MLATICTIILATQTLQCEGVGSAEKVRRAVDNMLSMSAGHVAEWRAFDSKTGEYVKSSPPIAVSESDARWNEAFSAACRVFTERCAEDIRKAK